MFYFSVSNAILHLWSCFKKTHPSSIGTFPSFHALQYSIQLQKNKNHAAPWLVKINGILSTLVPKRSHNRSVKNLVCFFSIHIPEAVLRILVVCIFPLLCLCLWASLILEGKNKMLTSVILLTLSASEGSRCRAEVKGTTSIVSMPRRT